MIVGLSGLPVLVAPALPPPPPLSPVLSRASSDEQPLSASATVTRPDPDRIIPSMPPSYYARPRLAIVLVSNGSLSLRTPRVACLQPFSLRFAHSAPPPRRRSSSRWAKSRTRFPARVRNA